MGIRSHARALPRESNLWFPGNSLATFNIFCRRGEEFARPRVEEQSVIHLCPFRVRTTATYALDGRDLPTKIYARLLLRTLQNTTDENKKQAHPDCGPKR